MTDPKQPAGGPDEARSTSLAYAQALKYGQDLQRLYLAERERRRELEHANSLLTTVFDSAPDGLLVLDDSYTIVAANPMLARLLETTREALVGAALASAFPLAAASSVIDALSSARGTEISTEIVLHRPVTRALAVIAARLEASGQPGWVLSFRDQTERRRLEYQKVEFVNIAAHELRTPLTSVMGLGELLREILPPDCDPDVRECVEGVVRGAHRLAGIVDQLVEFAQLTEGSIYTSGESEVLALVNDVLASARERAEAREVSLRVESALGGATPVPGNPMLLRAALLQLVMNGITFNRPGGAVTVKLGTSGGSLHIDVVDTGIGIPQAEVDGVLQPFVQVEDHNIRRVGGLGLGLPIVEHAITRLSGQVSIDSQLDAGTHVRVVVPLSQPEQDELAAMQARLDASNQQLMNYAQDLSRLRRGLEEQIVETLNGLLLAAGAADEARRVRFERTVSLARQLADDMDLSARGWTAIWVAAALHELVFAGTHHLGRGSWLGSLQQERAGGELVVPLLGDALAILAARGEHYDGSGEPGNRVGSEIPLEARLLAAVHTYERLTAPGEGALNYEDTAHQLRQRAGSVLDPAIVERLLRLTAPRAS